MLVHLDYLGQV